MKTFKDYKASLKESFKGIVDSFSALDEAFDFKPEDESHFRPRLDVKPGGRYNPHSANHWAALMKHLRAHGLESHPDGEEAARGYIEKAKTHPDVWVRNHAKKTEDTLAKASAPAAEPKAKAKPVTKAEKPAKIIPQEKPKEKEPEEKEDDSKTFWTKERIARYKAARSGSSHVDDEPDNEEEKKSGKTASADMGPPHTQFLHHLNSVMDHEPDSEGKVNVSFHNGETKRVHQQHVGELLAATGAIKGEDIKKAVLDKARSSADGFTAAHTLVTNAVTSAAKKAKEQAAARKAARQTSDFSHMEESVEGLEEGISPEDTITDFKDRQSYLGLKRMEADHLKQHKTAKSPIKKQHHLDMAQQHNDKAYNILSKYNNDM